MRKDSTKIDKDLTGKVFGRLTVTGLDNKSLKPRMPRYWHCECSCGKKKSIRGTNLTNGQTTSCGCYNKEKNQDDPSKRLAGAIKSGKYSEHYVDKGITFTEFCKSHGLSTKVVRSRLKKGWSMERTLSEPVDDDIVKRNKRSRAKGRKLEKYVSDLLRKIFGKYLEDPEVDIAPVAASRTGVDILLSKAARRLFPVSIECKNTVDWPGKSAMEQATKNAVGDTIPAVVWHEPNIDYKDSIIVFKFEEFVEFWNETRKEVVDAKNPKD